MKYYIFEDDNHTTRGAVVSPNGSINTVGVSDQDDVTGTRGSVNNGSGQQTGTRGRVTDGNIQQSSTRGRVIDGDSQRGNTRGRVAAAEDNDAVYKPGGGYNDSNYNNNDASIRQGGGYNDSNYSNNDAVVKPGGGYDGGNYGDNDVATDTNGGHISDDTNDTNNTNNTNDSNDVYENPYNFDHCYNNTSKGSYSLAVNYEKPENYNLIKSFKNAEKKFS